MEVVEYGISNVTALKYHEEMPIRYKLERPTYTIIAEINQQQKTPLVAFLVGEDSQNEVHLSAEYLPKCFGGFWAPLTGPKSTTQRLHFFWARSARRQCTDASPPPPSDRLITIIVSDFSGAVIATEQIPFSIKVNGKFYEYEG